MIIFINLKANSKRSDYCSNLSVVSVVYSKFYSIEVNILQKKNTKTQMSRMKKQIICSFMQIYGTNKKLSKSVQIFFN